MKHYKISLLELKKMTSYDQGMMIRALIEEPTQGGKRSFATEAEYQAWREQRRNSKTEGR